MRAIDWEENRFEDKFKDLIYACYPDVYEIKIDKQEERLRIYFKSYSLKVTSIWGDSKSALLRDTICCIEEGDWKFSKDYPQDVDWSRLETV